MSKVGNLKSSWVALAAAAAAVFIFFRSVGLTRIRDYDDFWHLWSGRFIYESGSVPRFDPVLFSSEGFDWVNLNWLAQLFNYRLFMAYGLAGPLALGGFLGAVVLLCHLQLIKRSLLNNTVSLFPALASIALVIWAIRFTHGSRPQDYSFALLAFLNLILQSETDFRKFSKINFISVTLLLLLWGNIHGGVIFGYILIGCDILGSIVDSKRSGSTGFPIGPRAFLLGLALALALAGFAFHPHGFAALLHVIDYSSSMKPILYQRVFELMPPSIAGTQGALLAIYGLLFGWLLIATRRFSPFSSTFFFVIFAALSQSMQRFITPLLVVTAPVAAELATYYLRMRKSSHGQVDPEQRKNLALLTCRLPSAVVAVLLFGWYVIFVPHLTPDKTPGAIDEHFVDQKMFPVGAARFLNSNRIEGKIFNEYGAGGFLGWALFPQRRIFIDGRGDLISQGPIIEQYQDVIEMKPGFTELIDSLGARIVILPARFKLSAALQADSGRWQKLYDDGDFTLFVRQAGQTPPPSPEEAARPK